MSLAIRPGERRRQDGLGPATTLRTGRDVTTPLVIAYVLLLFVLPARLTVMAMGGIGQPALLLGILLALMWCMDKVVPGGDLHRGPNPIRWALVPYAVLLLLNHLVLQLRPQTGLEASSSTRILIINLTMIGVALFVSDTLPGRRQLHAVLKAVVVGAAACAVVGHVQFFTGFDLPALLDLPGLDYSTPFDGVFSRSGMNRPAGTTLHPIEYGVVLGAALPPALHVALAAPHRRRVRWWIAVALIASGVLLSVSRSGVLAAGAALLPLLLHWDWRRRANTLLVAMAGLVVSWLALPNLISTFRSLFGTLETDPSAQARLERFPIAFETTMQRPWLGRGLGTYTVEEGTLLDQQLYQSAIELGLVGLALTVLLVGIAVGVGIAIFLDRRRTAADASLAMALVGAIAALAVSSATYTAFWYRIHLSLLFLVIGLLGALWTLVTSGEPTTTDAVAVADVPAPGTDGDDGRAADRAHGPRRHPGADR
ncbi:O-antigen ligase family protein [Egicoccus halophilus]|uniref:O-antigen ligase-related domain-containing protein n=1 Tax=Egicoccus halophilus TaxID=1670830 RepID=A0A8J3EX93_9ACTN|nr:O-antigen ligase family protein [Egicoccus halophilus]GGI05292.1 hypothetical protein GCM10011354_13370 [Egicoccus halophilus]